MNDEAVTAYVKYLLCGIGDYLSTIILLSEIICNITDGIYTLTPDDLPRFMGLSEIARDLQKVYGFIAIS